MSYRDWHVGMKVVCVKRGSWNNRVDGETHPIYGQICTIREIMARDDGSVWLRFSEIRNPPVRKGGIGCRYDARRFRKIQPRKTDISMLTALLNGAKERERV